MLSDDPQKKYELVTLLPFINEKTEGESGKAEWEVDPWSQCSLIMEKIVSSTLLFCMNQLSILVLYAIKTL